jgi:hypothetical protein
VTRPLRTFFDCTFAEEVLDEREREGVYCSVCTRQCELRGTALEWEIEAVLHGPSYPPGLALPGFLEVAQPAAYW